MKIIDINGNPRECVSVAIDKDWPEYLVANFESKVGKGHKEQKWCPFKIFLEKNKGIGIDFLEKAVGNTGPGMEVAE